MNQSLNEKSTSLHRKQERDEALEVDELELEERAEDDDVVRLEVERHVVARVAVGAANDDARAVVCLGGRRVVLGERVGAAGRRHVAAASPATPAGAGLSQCMHARSTRIDSGWLAAKFSARLLPAACVLESDRSKAVSDSYKIYFSHFSQFCDHRYTALSKAVPCG